MEKNITFKTSLVMGTQGADGQSYDIPENAIIQYDGDTIPAGYEEISDVSNVKYIKKTGDTPIAGTAKVIDNLGATANQHHNTLSIRAIRQLYSELYPIGSIYLSTNLVNPATIYGGVWRQLKDTFLLAGGDTYAIGTEGGSETATVRLNGSVQGHALTSNEIPAHQHLYEAPPSTTEDHVLTMQEVPSHTHTVSLDIPVVTAIDVTTGGTTQAVSTGLETTYTTDANGFSEGHSHNIDSIETNTGNTGGGQAHTHTIAGIAQTVSILPPYVAINAWVRIA